MPAPLAELARRDGVELIRTGSWAASTGTWNPTPKDILAAVEAMKCPAVGKPILKIGHLDRRFTPSLGNDGEPGIGWVDNLRAAEDGHLLLGDYVGVPAWIDQVMASAWPKRSIEGKYNYQCALSHIHDFALEAVSLLGTTAPAIPTLKSLNDVAQLYGVDIAASSDGSSDHVFAVVAAAAVADEAEPVDDGDEPEHTGAIVALIPTAEDAARLAIDGGEPASELHLTLAYLGEAADLGATGQQDIIDAVSSAVNGMPTVDANVFAVTAFNPGLDNGMDTCLVYGVTGDLLDTVHDFVMQAIDQSAAGTRIPPQIAPWVAHMTAAYTDDLGRLSDMASNLGPVRFDRIRLAFAGKYTDIPLIDEPDDVDPTAFDDDLEVPNILMPVAAASADKLREYWVHGKGAAKIRWGEKNDFYRCVKQLKRFVADPQGLCNTYHREALGVAPGQEDVHASGKPTPDLPAAEPEHQETQTEEDSVSLSDDMRSRLGLAEGADEEAAIAAIDALIARADKPAEPTPEMVAASAAATEQAQRAVEAQELMKEELTRVSGELAEIKASAAATVKASFFGSLVTAGKLKPADRETWEARYDRDPQMVTEILSARADGSEVPVMASGSIGSAEPENVDDEYEALVAALDGPKAV